MPPDPGFFRERLEAARVLLVFTPEVCGARDPVQVLGEVAELVDIIQVRCKTRAREGLEEGTTCAAETYEWTRRVLESLHRVRKRPLVMVNDRVDVALSLWKHGCAGVHLGQEDMSVPEARRLLGHDPLIGLSTHSLREAADAGALDVDYLGIGPIFPSETKGYDQGVGTELGWIVSEATHLPVFGIGGINRERVGELSRLGRVAVSSAILSAEDPRVAAQELRDLLLLSA